MALLTGDLVWYASYGSNILPERFMKYIFGGIAPGASITQVGCTNKTPPLRECPIILSHQLYFSQHISGWQNLGVAFIMHKSNPRVKTYGKMYLVTKEQFQEVVWQENNINDFKNQPGIDFEEVRRKKYIKIADSNYGRIIYLAEKDSIPIYTFTANWEDSQIEYIPPGPKYLKLIALGIKMTYSLTDEEVLDYFIQQPGIREKIPAKTLRQIFLDK